MYQCGRKKISLTKILDEYGVDDLASQAEVVSLTPRNHLLGAAAVHHRVARGNL